MTYNVSYYMNIGRRNNQEDCIFFNGKIFQEENIDISPATKINSSKALFAVCDGMGGHSKGEWASRFVCNKLENSLKLPDFNSYNFQDFIKGIQKEMEAENMPNSGTTLASVALNGSNNIIFNAGDSRVYKITDEDIVCLSHDDSLVQVYLDKGSLMPEEAFDHPNKNVITFGLGDVFKNEWDKDDKKVYIREDILNKNEYYLLCTDGVNDVLRDNEIFNLLRPDPFEKIQDFVEFLKERMNDNFSFIMIGNG